MKAMWRSSAVVLMFVSSMAAAADAEAPKPKTEIEAARAELESERRNVVETNLNLLPAEAKAFWPVYDAFRAKMHVLDARYIELANRFVQSTKDGELSDAQTRAMLDELTSIGVERATARKAWVDRFAKVLPIKKVAGYVQLENRLDAVMTLGIATQVPLSR